MENGIMFMMLCFITAPFLYWSRYNGSASLFVILLVVNILSGVLGVYLSGKDLGE